VRIKLNVVFKMYNRILGIAGHQWLTPVILATQDAEIRRIAGK
jgi:hypothetical protein